MSSKLNSRDAVMDFPRRDARDKLRGRTKYTVDIGGSDALHAVLLRATVPSARLISIDTSEAKKMPGVKAISTHLDAPGLHGIGISDQPIFASKIIRYHGEPIAAVAAFTKAQAEAAVAAIKVTLEMDRALLTMEEALRKEAPLVHPNWKNYEILLDGASRGGNIAWEATVERGDTKAAFSREDVSIVEGCYRVGRQSHVPFEPRAVVASYEDGRYHIHTSTQVPWTVRHVTAKVLGIPDAQVQVTVPAVGGGFGLKFDCSLEPYAAILAKKSGRSVSLFNSRRDEQMTCLCRENAEIRIRSAVTKEGEIVGREATVLMDCGAYGGEQVFLTSMTAHTLGGNYKLGSVRISSRAVYTNTPPNGAFRACNGVYNTFALERHTDEICKAIEMDQIEFRRRNVVGNADIGATGQVFEGNVLGPMLERILAKYPVNDVAKKLPDGRLYGRATTVGTWFVFVGPSAATVNLNFDGSVTLVTSGVEIGSGTMMQSLPQIVAASLGLHPSDVIVKTADTDASGRDLGVGGGRTTVSIGAASVAACDEVRNKLLSVASQMLQTKADDLILKNKRVEIKGHPGSGATIQTIVQQAEIDFGPISGSGAFTNPGVKAMPGCASGHFIDALDIPVFTVHDCEVAVDPDTGHVDVISYRIVQDVGRALNPRAIHGQIQGGVVQGLGYALQEEITINADGAFDQTSFETYRLPLAGDVLPIEFELFEGAPSSGPFGTKGAGEVPILNVGASVACAVANATGKAISELPLTPPRVLELLDDDAYVGISLSHISNEWHKNTL
ncbi:MAG: xanthine dehydrogenase family protein molybdopterin-binding subunit [Sneathiella sp.]|uniref:xanthine dehydrogenase family protein molybdopterin-binding subunit n=1 Tax=Sneathiella sp. TaxID=1964365 RepID=UPI00300190B5